jgi:hypothetical protein
MTEVLYNPKIKPEHLARKAIVYLGQSTDKQIRQNKESRLLQYAVAEPFDYPQNATSAGAAKFDNTRVI